VDGRDPLAGLQVACRLANSAGFVTVNDGPALAAGLARMIESRRPDGAPQFSESAL
jgi:hypothetical protein